jgi:hypothetical protein
MQHLGKRIGRTPSAKSQSKSLIFGRMRNFLCSLRIVKRHRMVFHPAIAAIDFIPIRKHPLLYLKQYIAATGIDPRHRVDRVGAQKLLSWPHK